MSETFYTADNHFGHKNIIHLCDRPFRSVEEMNFEMVERWNDVVGTGDTVYHLGDFSLDFKYVSRFKPLLNGVVKLIPGNHDLCHPHFNKPSAIEKYREYGFDVCEVEHRIQLEGESILLSHIPHTDPDDHRYPEYRPPNDGSIQIHGHVHVRWTVFAKQINVGVDVWDFAPVHQSEIIELIHQQC